MTLYWIHFEWKLDENHRRTLEIHVYISCKESNQSRMHFRLWNDKLQWLKYLHVHVITNFRLFFNSRTTIFLLVPLILYSFIKPCSPYWNNKKLCSRHFYPKGLTATLITGNILLGQHGIKCLDQRHNNVRSWINSCEALNYNYYLSEFNPTTWTAKAFWKSLARNSKNLVPHFNFSKNHHYNTSN